jgi:hypothetical protein
VTPAATKPVDRQAIFDEVVSMLATYSPPFEVRRHAKDGYHLWSNKPVEIEGRKHKDLFFAGVVSQKNYIGFYYMPVYTDPERKALFKPELLARLKGKSCFYLTKLDPDLKSQLKDALNDGFKLYKERGWI